jgi:murein L,D-transpeptidase YcbB/YkuD
LDIFCDRTDNFIGQATVKASAAYMDSRHRCRAIEKWILSIVLLVMAVIPAPSVPRTCHAAGDMDALTAAMSEHLVCYPLELMSLEKQQLAVTSKDLCLASVYHHTGLRPLWVTPEGPSPKASIILDFLSKAETEGLDPKNYEVDQISALFAARQPRSLARLDTLLTFNLIKYIHDVSRGRIKPRYAEPALFAEAGDVNFESLATMEKVLSVPDLAAYLASLPPAHQHYANLKRALMTYRAMEKRGGWPSITTGKTIRPGDQDDRIPAIIRRLSVTGDLDPEIAPVAYYDPLLENSIVRFQIRHGLTPDGVIGRNTFAALNVSVSSAIKQIIINMTRWRWQEHDLGEKYILVNIANFDLTAFESRREAFSFPVIVGKFQHQTPVFSDRIIYIEFNPYWNIPPSIARNEELPKLRKDPHYLVKRHIRLFSCWSADAGEIDSRTVDWKNVGWTRMGRYKLRQDPGPWNALGQVKFVFPNKYDVYLHDTPTQNLFSRTKRDFSHGCIRVSDPSGLAAFVLKDASGTWTPEEIDNIIKEGERVVIHLPEPLPVHITYQTSWVDKKGIIYFNRDVYGRDKKLLKALFNESGPRQKNN